MTEHIANSGEKLSEILNDVSDLLGLETESRTEGTANSSKNDEQSDSDGNEQDSDDGIYDDLDLINAENPEEQEIGNGYSRASDEDEYSTESENQNKTEYTLNENTANSCCKETVQKVQSQLEMCQTKMVILEKKLHDMEESNKQLNQQNLVLRKNITSLYKTARSETERKNVRIADLQARLDRVLFRRKSSKPSECSAEGQDNDINCNEDNGGEIGDSRGKNKNRHHSEDNSEPLSGTKRRRHSTHSERDGRSRSNSPCSANSHQKYYPRGRQKQAGLEYRPRQERKDNKRKESQTNRCTPNDRGRKTPERGKNGLKPETRYPTTDNQRANISKIFPKNSFSNANEETFTSNTVDEQCPNDNYAAYNQNWPVDNYLNQPEQCVTWPQNVYSSNNIWPNSGWTPVQNPQRPVNWGQPANSLSVVPADYPAQPPVPGLSVSWPDTGHATNNVNNWNKNINVNTFGQTAETFNSDYNQTDVADACTVDIKQEIRKDARGGHNSYVHDDTLLSPAEDSYSKNRNRHFYGQELEETNNSLNDQMFTSFHSDKTECPDLESGGSLPPDSNRDLERSRSRGKNTPKRSRRHNEARLSSQDSEESRNSYFERNRFHSEEMDFHRQPPPERHMQRITNSSRHARSPSFDAYTNRRDTPRSPGFDACSNRRDTPRSPGFDAYSNRRDTPRSPGFNACSNRRDTPRSPGYDGYSNRRNTPRSPGFDPYSNRRDTQKSASFDSYSQRRDVLRNSSFDSYSHRRNTPRSLKRSDEYFRESMNSESRKRNIDHKRVVEKSSRSKEGHRTEEKDRIVSSESKLEKFKHNNSSDRVKKDVVKVPKKISFKADLHRKKNMVDKLQSSESIHTTGSRETSEKDSELNVCESKPSDSISTERTVKSVPKRRDSLQSTIGTCKLSAVKNATNRKHTDETEVTESRNRGADFFIKKKRSAFERLGQKSSESKFSSPFITKPQHHKPLKSLHPKDLRQNLSLRRHRSGKERMPLKGNKLRPTTCMRSRSSSPAVGTVDESKTKFVVLFN